MLSFISPFSFLERLYSSTKTSVKENLKLTGIGERENACFCYCMHEHGIHCIKLQT